MGLSTVVPAADWQDGDWEFGVHGRMTVAAAVRTEHRDPALIGKSNLDPALCAADECLTADPDNHEPNDRYLAAPGAFNSLYDEGDLNYDRGDVVAAPVKYSGVFNARKDELKAEIGLLVFYDPVNTQLKEKHPNQVVEPGVEQGVAVRTRRDDPTLQDIGYNLQLLDAYVQNTFTIGDRPVDVSIGRQRLVWGESTFVTQGSLNIINPPDANNLVRPGMDLDEVYRSEGMLTVRAPINDDWSGEGFYQFEWRPYGIPARGAFLSFFNAGNEPVDNEGIIAPFAKTPYDPEQIGTPANPVFALLTETSFTLGRAANRDPGRFGQGQYGLAFYFHPEWTDAEFGFYFANYHSRLPSVSATAAEASCARREGNPSGIDAVDLLSLIAACGAPGAHMREAVPLDTASYFLEYPEDIRLYGLSFSSVYNGLAVRGELAYRPNQPVQVDLEDVIFAALQPSLPRQDIPLFGVGTDTTLPGLISALQDPANILAVAANEVGNLPSAITALETLLTSDGVLNLTFPGSRRVPDFITEYRGGTAGEISPGQYIRGYERLDTLQGSLGLTRIYGNSHYLGTTDALLLAEFAGTWVPGLPSVSRIQFEAPGTDTHAGPGAADSGNALFLNPVRNEGGYVTEFAWGYRLGAMLHYSDVLIQDLDLRPFFVFTHDVDGVSPGLGENTLEGRKLAVLDLHISYGPTYLSLTQTYFWGGGNHNTLHDRDYFAASVGLQF
jgi:hypothetical protein